MEKHVVGIQPMSEFWYPKAYMSVRAHAILHIGKSKISIYLVDIYRERKRALYKSPSWGS